MSIQDPFVWLVLVVLLVLAWASLSQRRRLNQLERASKTDPLTGLGSATWLESERWYAALRSNRPLCVVWVDLDRLKFKNDNYGHIAGDALIKGAARALTMSSRRGVDEVFRLHTKGDEFLVLLHGPLDVHTLARKIQGELKRHSVMASVGIAYSTETRFLPARAELRSKAERKCKAAKARGGDCVLVDEGSVTHAGETREIDKGADNDRVPEPIDDNETARLCPEPGGEHDEQGTATTSQ